MIQRRRIPTTETRFEIQELDRIKGLYCREWLPNVHGDFEESMAYFRGFCGKEL